LRNVSYHVLRDFDKQKADAERTPAGGMPQEMIDNYIAFTSLLWVPDDSLLYCGVLSYCNDIVHAFDVESKTFRSLGYQQVAEKFEVKTHRSLELAGDGTIYGASAGLLGFNQRLEAPGGSVYRLPPGTRRPEKLCVPCPHDYIQTITLDDQRNLVYGFTWPALKFFVYHIDTGEVEDYDCIGGNPHITALDDDGRLWGTWGGGFGKQQCLFSYDPATRSINWTTKGLPGDGGVDGMVNGGDGYIYIGTVGGALCRLDPAKGEAEWLGKPTASNRMPGLTVWRDRLLLGIAGSNKATIVFTYDIDQNVFRTLGPIVASEDGKPLHRPHDLALVGTDTLYVAETDVPGRSGYLWECQLED